VEQLGVKQLADDPQGRRNWLPDLPCVNHNPVTGWMI
jgi:hypothetical protein